MASTRDKFSIEPPCQAQMTLTDWREQAIPLFHVCHEKASLWWYHEGRSGSLENVDRLLPVYARLLEERWHACDAVGPSLANASRQNSFPEGAFAKRDLPDSKIGCWSVTDSSFSELSKPLISRTSLPHATRSCGCRTLTEEPGSSVGGLMTTRESEYHAFCLVFFR
jgi:hypothetical protein